MYILPHESDATTPPTSAAVFDHPSPVLVLPRQASTTTISSTATPSPSCGGQYTGGALAGAILGTFFGTLLVIYLFNVIRENAIMKRAGGEAVIVEKMSTKSRRRRSHGAESFHSGVRRPSGVYSTR